MGLPGSGGVGGVGGQTIPPAYAARAASISGAAALAADVSKKKTFLQYIYRLNLRQTP
jgi:hypothetical protein